MSKNGLRDQLLFKLGISTGLRCGDLVVLKVEEVLMAGIVDYIETLPKEAVFLFASHKGGGHITTTQAYRIISKAGDMIGNNSIGTHTIVRRLATHTIKLQRM